MHLSQQCQYEICRRQLESMCPCPFIDKIFPTISRIRLSFYLPFFTSIFSILLIPMFSLFLYFLFSNNSTPSCPDNFPPQLNFHPNFSSLISQANTNQLFMDSIKPNENKTVCYSPVRSYLNSKSLFKFTR